MIKDFDIPLEDYREPDESLSSDLNLKNEYQGSVDFGVVGLGQCGGKLVASFDRHGYKKSLAVNSASVDLDALDIPQERKLLIGDGSGSGKDMAVGYACTKEASQKIFDLMRIAFGTVDRVILCIGFGGGTGAGGLPVLIEVAKKYLGFIGALDVATKVSILAALPSSGELQSSRVKENVEAVLNTVKDLVSRSEVGPIFIIDNAKIEKIYRGIPPKVFWNTVNDSITGLFQAFNYISTEPSSLTSFDKADYSSLLSVPGIASMGVTRIKEVSNRASLSAALQDNLRKNILLDSVSYSSAKAGACILAVNSSLLESVGMDVFDYAFDAFSTLAPSASLYRGLYESDGEGVLAYTMLVGMS